MRLPLVVKLNPWLCDLSYILIRKMGFFNKFFDYIYSTKKTKLVDNSGNYPISRMSIALTNICNARCTFCAYPKTSMKRGYLEGDDFIQAVEIYKKLSFTNTIDLTPTVGDVLLDKDFYDRVSYLESKNIGVQFTTNLIAAQPQFFTSEFLSKVKRIHISLPSLDTVNYIKIYGIDRFEIVFKNLLKLLESNKNNGSKTQIFIYFRNSLRPSTILKSANFRLIRPYMGNNVSISFTAWFDNWGGTVSEKHIEGFMKLKPSYTINKPCIGLQNLSILQDGKIRLCGCRFKEKENDDLVVGTVNSSIDELKQNIKPIADGFYKGVRPSTCVKCTFYRAA